MAEKVFWFFLFFTIVTCMVYCTCLWSLWTRSHLLSLCLTCSDMLLFHWSKFTLFLFKCLMMHTSDKGERKTYPFWERLLNFVFQLPNKLLTKDRIGRWKYKIWMCCTFLNCNDQKKWVFIGGFSQFTIYLGFNPSRLKTKTNILWCNLIATKSVCIKVFELG